MQGFSFGQNFVETGLQAKSAKKRGVKIAKVRKLALQNRQNPKTCLSGKFGRTRKHKQNAGFFSLAKFFVNRLSSKICQKRGVKIAQSQKTGFQANFAEDEKTGKMRRFSLGRNFRRQAFGENLAEKIARSQRPKVF